MPYPLAVLGFLAAFLWPWELIDPGAFIVGDWAGSANYQDLKFVRCEMSATRAPWKISVGIDRDNKPFVGFAHDSIIFKEKKLDGHLHIGPDDPGVAVVLLKVEKAKEHAVRAYISPEVADRLIGAHYYRLTGGEIFADFETGSLRRAWPELQHCAMTRGSR
jgi:hypothetical protein